jgi:DNA-binding CsgD family transcriptional regulator
VTHLRDKDLSALLELVAESQRLVEPDQFRAGLLPLVRRAVPCAMATYNEFEPGTDNAVALFDPPEAMIFDDPGELLARVAPSNPLITRFAETRDGHAYKISDFITRSELHETAIWKEAYRPLGVEYQMAFALPSQPSVVIGIALSDGERDFSERDRELLNRARPQLVQAYRNAHVYSELRARLASLEHGLEAAGQATVLLRPDGRIDAASPEARRMLAAGLNGQRARGQALPPVLERWVEERRAAPAAQEQLPLVLGAGRERVVVRFVRLADTTGRDVLFMERSHEPMSASSLDALGLTARESEVLRLAALGDTSGQIAGRLSISADTVRKHFENVYRKLGVHSRAQAVAAAWAVAETKRMPSE